MWAEFGAPCFGSCQEPPHGHNHMAGAQVLTALFLPLVVMFLLIVGFLYLFIRWCLMCLLVSFFLFCLIKLHHSCWYSFVVACNFPHQSHCLIRIIFLCHCCSQQRLVRFNPQWVIHSCWVYIQTVCFVWHLDFVLAVVSIILMYLLEGNAKTCGDMIFFGFKIQAIGKKTATKTQYDISVSSWGMDSSSSVAWASWMATPFQHFEGVVCKTPSTYERNCRTHILKIMDSAMTQPETCCTTCAMCHNHHQMKPLRPDMVGVIFKSWQYAR